MSDPAAGALPEDLLLVARAVRIESPTRYLLLGEPREVPPPHGAGGAEGTDAPPLVPILETDLYVHLYSRLYLYPGHVSALGAGDPLRLAQRSHVTALSAANDGRGTWEAGWRITAVEEDGRAAVRRDEVTFWVGPEGLRARRIAPGEPCRVRVGKELRNLVPGFYVAIGNGPAEAGSATLPEAETAAGPLVRLYWHLRPEAAVPYMAAATSRLNALAIPFRTKVLVDPALYARADAGVLYVERRHFEDVREPIREIHAAMAAGLRPEVPLFTRALAPGLGVAEDPGNGLSFGQARCRTAAAALWRAFQAGEEGEPERAAGLAEAFAREGLDPRRLHLAPGSRQDYDLQPPAAVPRSRRRQPGQPRATARGKRKR